MRLTAFVVSGVVRGNMKLAEDLKANFYPWYNNIINNNNNNNI